MNFEKIVTGIAKGVSIANKVSDAIGKYGNMAVDYAQTPIKDIKLPVQNEILKNIFGTVKKVLDVGGQIVKPFEDQLVKVPFAGPFLSKAADVLFNKVAPFMDGSLATNIDIVGRHIGTAGKIADFFEKAGKVLDNVEAMFPAQQHNASRIAARAHADTLIAAN